MYQENPEGGQVIVGRMNHEEEEEEENLFVNQINTVQNVSEETNDWLPKRASLSSWSPNLGYDIYWIVG